MPHTLLRHHALPYVAPRAIPASPAVARKLPNIALKLSSSCSASRDAAQTRTTFPDSLQVLAESDQPCVAAQAVLVHRICDGGGLGKADHGRRNQVAELATGHRKLPQHLWRAPQLHKRCRNIAQTSSNVSRNADRIRPKLADARFTSPGVSKTTTTTLKTSANFGRCCPKFGRR